MLFENLRYNLKHNRKNVTKTVSAWVIFGIIILVFIGWGMTPKNQTMQGGSAAMVNGQVIPMSRLQETVERMRRDPRFQQYEQLGGDLGPKILQSQALSQVVEMELVKQQTEKEHIWTTDAEVRDTVTAIPQFQEGGQFRRELYNNYLRAVGKSGAEFENEIREERSLRRTVELFRASLSPLPLELERQKALSAMKANVEFVRIPTDALVPAASIKPAEVAAYLAQPENEKKVKASFESRKQEFSTEESVHARHILIKTEAGASDEVAKKALEKAQDVAKRAKAPGANFAALAKEFSDDPGSKDKGGDLGFFGKGRMIPEFEKVAFAAKINEVSDPVKTQFGYHIIQVQEKKPAETRGYDQVKNQVAAELIAKDQARVALEALEGKLKAGDSAALNAFVTEHKLKWEESGAFAVDADQVPKMGEGEEGVRVAFGLTAAKPLAERLIRQGPAAFALRYKAPPAVAAVKDPKSPEQNPEVAASFTANRRSEDAIRQWMEKIRKEAKITMNESLGAGPGGGSQTE